MPSHSPLVSPPCFLRIFRGDIRAKLEAPFRPSGRRKRQPEEGFSLLVSAYRFPSDAPLEFYPTRASRALR